MSKYWSDVIGGARSLVTGLSITAREFLRPVITRQYPWEVPEIPDRYRGHIELIRDRETGRPKCIVCGMCQRNCPSGCISLAGKKQEGEKKKSLTRYSLDFTTCSLCGTCIESCKFGAIRFSKEYNLTSVRKEDYIFDLLGRLTDQSHREQD